VLDKNPENEKSVLGALEWIEISEIIHQPILKK
jgi:hypothetical protein